MEYEGQICRAPMERSSYMLPVSVGCAYNRCRFCTLFKHVQYRLLPLDQIRQELERVKAAGGAPQTVFLGDGSAFQLETDRLLAILEMLHEYFPSCRAVHMDATVTSIRQKTDAELQALWDSGVRRLYLGIESGLEDVLSFMKKDHTLAEAYEQIGRLKAIGFTYGAHIMTGVAGQGRGVENAEATAKFLNETEPCSVTNFSMFLHRKAPLFREIQAVRFSPADELENLQEAHRLLELLEVPLDFDSLHDGVLLRARGKLPRDREKLLSKLEEAIARRTGEGIFTFVD